MITMDSEKAVDEDTNHTFYFLLFNFYFFRR